MKKLFLIPILLFIIYSCSLDELTQTQTLQLRSEFVNETNSNAITDGIFSIWWDRGYDYSSSLI